MDQIAESVVAVGDRLADAVQFSTVGEPMPRDCYATQTQNCVKVGGEFVCDAASRPNTIENILQSGKEQS
jgi:hypothetical protein